MKGAYQAQPYRKGQPRPPTDALAAMLRGRPFHLPHPRDAHRAAQKQHSKLLAAARQRRR